MKKKFFAALLAVSLLGNAALPVYAAQVRAQGHEMETLEVAADGKTVDMLPLRETADALGLTVSWDKADASVSVTDGATTARIDTKANIYASTDGKEIRMEAKAERRDGKVYVPVSFFERFFFIRQSTGEDGMVTLENKEVKDPTVLNEFMALEDGDWLGLTAEQKQEDLDYLYNILEENYPYAKLLERRLGVNLEEEYKKAREMTAQTTTDAQLFVILEWLAGKAEMTGHLSVITPFEYDYYVEVYQNLQNMAEEEHARMRRLGAVYGNEESAETYDALEDLMWPVYQKVMDYYGQTPSDGAQEEIPNVETKILEEGRIAYIAIHSFDMSKYEESEKALFDFYEQVKDYDHVIFDLTGNGGGGSVYFDDLIAAPNIDEPLEVKTYFLMKDGDYNLSFFGRENFASSDVLAELPRMNQDDLKELPLVLQQENVVMPLYQEKLLKGKLWMLVDGEVFSSSEYAAMMTKATGFATLVGTTTGGDGIGTDPLPVVLPNSKIIVRYSEFYGTTDDGAGSQEYGTEPDIPCRAGETPLEACLRAIAAE